MHTIADRTTTYKRIALCAQFRGEYGQAIRDQRGAVGWIAYETMRVVQIANESTQLILKTHS